MHQQRMEAARTSIAAAPTTTLAVDVEAGTEDKAAETEHEPKPVTV